MKRAVPLAALAVVGVLLSGLTLWRVVEAIQRRANAAEATAVTATVPVDVLIAGPRDLVADVRVAGTLRPLHEADVVADVPGRVEAVLADVGAAVRKGQPLARLEQHDLELQVDQARAALAGAQAGQETAARDLGGVEAVAAQGGVAEATLVAARSRAAAADAQVAQAQAAVGLAQARLDDAVLRAPFDGVVVRRSADVGRLVSPGVPAFGVADLSELELVVPVDERVAAALHAGDRVGVVSDAVAGAGAEGRVKTVAPMLDPHTHKADVVIGLAQAPGLFAHGGATATFRLGRAEGVIAVPSGALVESDGEPAVYVVEAGVARRTAVRAGIRDGDWVEVTGIPAGASVVVTGNTYLSDGAAVTVRKDGPS